MCKLHTNSSTDSLMRKNAFHEISNHSGIASTRARLLAEPNSIHVGKRTFIRGIEHRTQFSSTFQMGSIPKALCNIVPETTNR